MELLNSLAEQNALKSARLSNFMHFNLQSFKNEIKDLLDLIGRNSSGIFLTYSKHDISHINAMLEMADWLIIEKTKSKMTSVDWLLIVLSCYLHDLGMIVTDKEFNNRSNDSKFQDFKNRVLTDPSTEDYRNRINEIDEINKDKFLFQEYVRSTHALRIKEWINGTNIEKWEDKIGTVVMQIHEGLSKLPSRFVNSLALVCESHHKEDIADESKFPLYEPYGNTKDESANVQYAAIILRTLDLLHITKDRTPSVTFMSLNITDPIGILEWEKQMGTYSVLPISRDVKEDDPETQIIQVTADFIEERPFFTLSEYISYADSQIKQSKTWIEKSSQSDNGKNYLFPWHSIKSNIKVAGNDPIPLKFELDRGKLLDLLVGHTIYNDPTVVIRELLQNSIDATRYRNYREGVKYKEPNIKVIWNAKESELEIIDNGTGMDKFIITNHLMRVGASFYNTKEFQNQNTGFSPISKFGIGILTCFMVSDDIEIITKKGEKGFRIKMTSVHSNYLLKELSEEHPSLDPIKTNGTRIKLKLRSSINNDKRNVKDILKYWIIFPPCPVYYIETEDEKENETIGFDNTEDAFNYFYVTERIKEVEYNNLVVKNEKKKIGDEAYEISFAIYNSMSNIPYFLLRQREGPVICLEGIRVLNRFPILSNNRRTVSRWQDEYARYKSIAAILSIKNNPKIRTTVSRDGLEIDEEYKKLGKIIIEFILKSIEIENSRIRELSEKPFSRASIASQWMLETVQDSFMGEMANEEIDKFHNRLPTIVVESITNNSFERKLISKQDFFKSDTFWTVESRLLNYLGILSKDLGRELGFNTFIEKLAPDLLNKNVTPLLIQSTNFDSSIFENYKASIANYSQLHQQVSIKWIKTDNVNFVFKKFEEKIDIGLIYSAINKYMNYKLFQEYPSEEKMLSNSIKRIYGCQICGVDKEIKYVINEENILLHLQSDVLKNWNILVRLLDLSLDSSSINDIYTSLAALYLFYKSCRGKKTSDQGSVSSLNLLWNATSSKLYPLLEKYHLNKEIENDNLSNLTGDSKEWFTASSYWSDWKKKK